MTMTGPAAQKSRWFTRLKNGAGFVLGSLFLPHSLKQLATHIAIYFVINPLTLLLFPRVESVMAKNGLSPELKKQLSPQAQIYVRGDNILGTLHKLTNNSPLVMALQGTLFSRYQSVFDHLIIASASESNPMLALIASDIRAIDVNYAKTAEKNPDQVKRIFLHEIYHTNPASGPQRTSDLLTAFMREARCDSAAFAELKRLTPPADIERLMFELSQQTAETHNTALYIDAVINNRPAPSLADIFKANAEAKPFITSIIKISNDYFDHKASDDETRIHLSQLEEKAGSLSPLAKQRVRLLLGNKYF